MPLSAGTNLGTYEVLSAIGAGGMGVYQTHDTKLGRDVAIKVLLEAFARDPQRLARFQREAKLLASLNHTNVATIHDIEDSNGTSNLVMELVPGETVQERIRSEGAEGPRALSGRTILGWSRRNPGRCPGLITSGISVLTAKSLEAIISTRWPVVLDACSATHLKFP
jgi:serine/threonine protein kinase